MVYCSEKPGFISQIATNFAYKMNINITKFDSTQFQEGILKKSLQCLLLIVCLDVGRKADISIKSLSKKVC